MWRGCAQRGRGTLFKQFGQSLAGAKGGRQVCHGCNARHVRWSVGNQAKRKQPSDCRYLVAAYTVGGLAAKLAATRVVPLKLCDVLCVTSSTTLVRATASPPTARGRREGSGHRGHHNNHSGGVDSTHARPCPMQRRHCSPSALCEAAGIKRQ